ncbi:MAG: hypothetical protein RMK57_15715 [Bryobacterales bacterium]|nr:hypothetical protein [Bryobacteraceae bacterium]MDW8355969.1 hypothetical protein [Bryobacterales bacterium]
MNLLAVASVLSLAGCLAAPVAYFLGLLEVSTYKQVLLVFSLAWFVAATTWAFRKS